MKRTIFYYIVTAKCGHVGKGRYVPIDFPVLAKDKKEAAEKTRHFPRVKHHQKDAIINVMEVNKEEYLRQMELNNNNEYLHCKNVQDQLRISNFADMIVEERIKEIVKTKRSSCEYKNRKQMLERIAYDKYSEECALA